MYYSYMEHISCNLTYINAKGEKVSNDISNVSNLIGLLHLILAFNRIIIELKIGDTLFDVIERNGQISLIPFLPKEASKSKPL